MIALELPPLHAAQHEVARDATRHRVVCAGRRFGKSRLGTVLALDAAARGGRAAWVAPTYAQAGIAWRLLRPMARAIPGADVREAERRLVLPGAGEIWCKSGDRPDNLRGEGYDFVALDECAYLAPEVWNDVLRPALADRRGRALFISTPRREHDFFHALYQRGQGGDPEFKSWRFPSWSNPHLDAAEVEALRAGMGALEFRREVGAEFVGAAGARVQRAWLREGLPAVAERLVIGVDLAISERATADWSALVVLAVGLEDARFVLDARRTRASFHDVLAWIDAAARDHGPDVVAVEDVAFQRAAIQELQRTTAWNIQAVRPQGDKVARFAPLEARIEQGLVRFAPGLPPAYLDELCAFPIGAHDDWCDATSLAFAASCAPRTQVFKFRLSP